MVHVSRRRHACTNKSDNVQYNVPLSLSPHWNHRPLGMFCIMRVEMVSVQYDCKVWHGSVTYISSLVQPCVFGGIARIIFCCKRQTNHAVALNQAPSLATSDYLLGLIVVLLWQCCRNSQDPLLTRIVTSFFFDL